jgi:hypothetical protein
MTVQWKDSLRNALLDAWETAIGTSAKVNVYNGTPPADESTALSGNTLLAQFSLDSDWASAAASGVKNMTSGGSTVSSGNPYTTTGAATGTASFYRIYDSAGTTCYEQGTVTATGGGGDMTIDNTSIASAQTVNLTQFQKTAPG